MSIILVWTCYASVLFYCINAKCIEENEIHGYRYNHRKHHEEDKIARSREDIIKRGHENHHEHGIEVTRSLNKIRDERTLDDELTRRHLHSHVERRTNDQSHEKQHPNEHVHDKSHREEREKRVLLSLERKLEKHKRERQEKDKCKATTVHPLFRRFGTKSTTVDSQEIFTASSGLLHELHEKRKQFTGDSAHYDRLYYEEYKNVTYPEDVSISEDYASWEKWYEDYLKKPQNETTPHYAWWTYDPNETCEYGPQGVPLNYDRVLYSLKMSSRLPHNVSAEVDAMYGQKSEISRDYAMKEKKSMEDWAKRENFDEINSDAGPVPERRELRDPYEIAKNRFEDKEFEWGVKLEEDVKNYLVKPALKGLYHVKKWMNPKYTTTTKRPYTKAMTWPSHSMETEEMLGIYKKYLREERGLNISDEAGLSVFEKYRFTADSNYYDEDTYDMPHHTLHPY